MAANFGELQQYYKDFMTKFYSGKGLFSQEELAGYKTKEKTIEKTGAAMGRVYAESISGAFQGTRGSSIGEARIQQRVLDPMAEKFSELDLEKAQLGQQRQSEREAIGMGFAQEKYKEEQEKGKGFWGSVGKLVGTAAGIGASFIPGVGPVVGAGISGLTNMLFSGSGGDGGGFDPELMQMIIDLQNKKSNKPGDREKDTTLG